MRVFRLEFLQLDGRWTGPYSAEYMTSEAFVIRDEMLRAHRRTRSFPNDDVFAANPGVDRYVCGSPSMKSLVRWFESYLLPLQDQGGNLGEYEVPDDAVSQIDGEQVVYQQRRSALVRRTGSSVDPDLLICRIHPSKSSTRRHELTRPGDGNELPMTANQNSL